MLVQDSAERRRQQKKARRKEETEQRRELTEQRRKVRQKIFLPLALFAIVCFLIVPYLAPQLVGGGLYLPWFVAAVIFIVAFVVPPIRKRLYLTSSSQ